MAKYLNFLISSFLSFIDFFLSFWWLIFPIILTYIFFEKYHSNKLKRFIKKGVRYKFFEIIFPEVSLRTPKLMEEVFAALHAKAEPFSSLKQLAIGYFPLAYILILEIHDKKIKFFIGVEESKSQFLKSSFYSKYPEVKFQETISPLKKFNFNLPNPLYEGLFFEVLPNNPDLVILRTYTPMEHLPPEERIDPASGFWEIKESISNKEWLYFIIFALPILPNDPALGKNWIQRYKNFVDILIGKPIPPQPLPFTFYLQEFFRNLLIGLFKTPEWSPITPPPPPPFEFNIGKLTPEQKNLIEKILQKIEKPGYLVRIETLYLTTKELFPQTSPFIPSLILSAFKNFGFENITFFVLNPFFKVPITDRFYKFKNFLLTLFTFDDLKSHKAIIIKATKFSTNEAATKMKFVLNTEELATLFHHPLKPEIRKLEEIEPPSFRAF